MKLKNVVLYDPCKDDDEEARFAREKEILKLEKKECEEVKKTGVFVDSKQQIRTELAQNVINVWIKC